MNAFDAICLELDEEVRSRKEYLAQGSCTHDEYLKICGEIKGLLFAYSYVQDLKQRMESSDE